MIEFDYKLGGVEQNLLRIAGAARQAGGRRLYQFGEAVMTKSKTEYCPVDTGNLRNTGFVGLPVVSTTSIDVRMAYGGTAADYAVRQHEDMTHSHKVGQAKYLERPLLLMAPLLAAYVGAGLLSEV